jgi:hypothetical protein
VNLKPAFAILWQAGEQISDRLHQDDDDLAHHFQFGAQSFRRWGALPFASTVWHVADHSATRPGAACGLPYLPSPT